MLLHEPHRGAGELVRRRGLGRPRHHLVHRDVQEIIRPLHQAGEVSRRHHADEAPRLIHHRGRASLVCQQHDALPHGALRKEGRQVLRDHHVADAQQQVAAERASRVQRSEVLAAEPLLLEQRDGEGVAQGEGGGRAGRRGEDLGARFFRDARVEHDVRLARERGLGVAGDRDHGHAEALQLAHEAEQLIGAAALREQDRRVVPADDAQIAVQRVDGVQERRGRAGGRERGRDLARDDARFPDAGDDQPPLRPGEQSHGRGERRAQAFGDLRDRLRFERQHAPAALNEIVALRVRHRRAPRSTSRQGRPTRPAL